MIFLLICGPAMQIGLYMGANSALPPPMHGVEPFTKHWPSLRQYVWRTSSCFDAGTYRSQISSGSLTCASQSNTDHVFVVRSTMADPPWAPQGGGRRPGCVFRPPTVNAGPPA